MFFFQGETIGNENPEIKSDLLDACREVRAAGESIKHLTCITDRQAMIQAARSLLSAVTRVLLLADMVVVKQIINIKKQVETKKNSKSNQDFNELLLLGYVDIESIGECHVFCRICEIVCNLWQSNG